MKQRQFLFSILFVWVSPGMFAWEQNYASLNCAVTDPASAPLANVSATLSSLDRALQAESGTDGQFRFPSVPPGTYDLEVSAAGFVKQKLPLTLSSGDSRTLRIVLKVGSIPDMNYCGPHPSIRYEISDPKRPKLAGTVRDYSEKRPVTKAEIALLRAGEKQPILACRSDHTGKFTFDNPRPGRYTLRISRRGYWEEDMKELLIPRENSVFIVFPILKRNRIAVCE